MALHGTTHGITHGAAQHNTRHNTRHCTAQHRLQVTEGCCMRQVRQQVGPAAVGPEAEAWMEAPGTCTAGPTKGLRGTIRGQHEANSRAPRTAYLPQAVQRLAQLTHHAALSRTQQHSDALRYPESGSTTLSTTYVPPPQPPPDLNPHLSLGPWAWGPWGGQAPALAQAGPPGHLRPPNTQQGHACMGRLIRHFGGSRTRHGLH